MAVKSGYKQTEVGVIPAEWQLETIGRLIEERFILSHLDGNHGELYPRSHEFKSHGVPYIGANDFEEGKVTFGRCKFLTLERAKQFRKGVAKNGDVLFAHNATVGPVALLRTSEPFVILSTTATYFRCDSDKLDNSYLKAALQSEHFIRQYHAVMAQSTRFQVPITAQRKLSLVIPPVHEQRAIAGALSDVDALLGSLDRLIAKKRDLKQAAMQQLLTSQTRLPGFHCEWEMKLLPQVCQFRGGKAHEQYIAEFGQFVCVNSKFISTDGKERKYSTVNVCCARKNDILMVMSDLPNGRALAKTYLVERDNLYAVNQRVCALTAYRDCPQFLSYILNRNPYFLKFNDGVSQTHLLNNVFLKCPLRIPPTVAEQAAIAEVLTDMDAELAALEQRREKTRALKQAMMQELLTGRIRLVEPGKTAANNQE